MRIVIDLQAAQSPGSRVRGIGRYSIALAEAMARLASPEHDIWIALNHGIADSVDPLRNRFAPLVGEQRVVVWESLPGVQGADVAAVHRRRAAELLRERFLANLAPDIVHTSSLFEGWGDDTVTSIGRLPGDPLQVATLYDLIPLVRRETYLRDARVRAWYMEKITHLGRADLLLAISDFSRNEAIEVVGIEPGQVVNISGACDPIFRHLDATDLHRITPALRARHGLRAGFVLYTGGFDGRKNIDGLIRAFAALPADILHGRQLAIVGKGPEQEVQRLRVLALEQGLAPTDVVFTGYVDDEDLCALYNLCELYVFPSFHEGFGLPALEAMACGAPVIGANATSLPEVIGMEGALFDPASTESMTRRIMDALTSEPLRDAMRQHASRQIHRFSWTASAERALAAMVEASGSRDRGKRRKMEGDEALDAAAAAVSAGIPDSAYPGLRDQVARALALNIPPTTAGCRLFVDVTMLADVDFGTGIQRVVRNILRQWLLRPPPEYAVEPVRYVADLGYVHAHAFQARFAGDPGEGGPSVEATDRVIDPYPGDVVVGLDLIAHLMPDGKAYFRWLRDRGVRLWFVVYDLLPVLRPEFFPPGGLGVFQRWYETVGELADGAVCISRAVAEELGRWFDQIQPSRSRPLPIGHFHLGADLHDDAKAGPGAEFTRQPATFLMVGTVERRKGHAQVLAAFERLWREGVDAKLVIVGKPGWLVEDLVEKMLGHPEAGARLEWHAQAGDQALLDLYASSSALLMASEGEGFGLPLIEAAQHGLPLIARDLPVFREVAGDGAFYFVAPTDAELAVAIESWMALHAQGRHPPSSAVSWITWEQSARQLQAGVLDGRVDVLWVPHAKYLVAASDPRIATQNGRLEHGRLVSSGTPGYLVYGPYSRIKAGRYECRVVLEAPAGKSRARVDMVAFEAIEVLYARDLGTEPEKATADRIELAFPLHLAHDLPDFQVRVYVPAGDLTAFVECTLAPVPERAAQEPRTDIKGIA